ncbi:hypothetical protein Ahy_B06g084425 isoform A [Arachis hypogaea]|uniref:Uncharacterized protein n=1 Tax=Arachis hypogaea TaxID=3818 RepID=A0A444YRV1_ARAHY|nr:hypothetical protein Ahy_B06g084425 isoform A [Arachis hypogaea]
MVRASNLMPIGVSSYVPVIEAVLIAPPSFAAAIAMADTPIMISDNDDDDDVEPATITNDSDHEIARSILVGVVELVRKLNLDVMTQQGLPEVASEFGTRDTHDTGV